MFLVRLRTPNFYPVIYRLKNTEYRILVHSFFNLFAQMKMKKLFFGISLLALFWGCTKNDPGENATRLRIKLTDEPTTYLTELNLDIERIEVFTHPYDASEGTWSVLDFNGVIFDLLKFSNGKSKQIVDQYYPAGVIKQIKIVFGNKGKLKTAEGEKDIIIPPEIMDGVVMDVDINLYAHVISSIMIDINAAQSIYESNGNYFLNPSMRIFPETYGGILKGRVLPTEANAFVAITQDEQTLISFPESEGMFQFIGLQGGEWEVHVKPHSQSGYQDTTFTQTIEEGKVNEITSIIELKPITN